MNLKTIQKTICYNLFLLVLFITSFYLHANFFAIQEIFAQQPNTVWCNPISCQVISYNCDPYYTVPPICRTNPPDCCDLYSNGSCDIEYINCFPEECNTGESCIDVSFPDQCFNQGGQSRACSEPDGGGGWTTGDCCINTNVTPVPTLTPVPGGCPGPDPYCDNITRPCQNPGYPYCNPNVPPNLLPMPLGCSGYCTTSAMCSLQVSGGPFLPNANINVDLSNGIPNWTYDLNMNPYPNCTFPPQVNTRSNGTADFVVSCNQTGTYTVEAIDTGGTDICGDTFEIAGEPQPTSVPRPPTPTGFPGNFNLNWSTLYQGMGQSGGDFQFSTNTTIAQILSPLLTYIFPAAGLLLLLFLIYGGFVFLTSAGNPARIAMATSVITNALIGFAVVFVSYWLVQLLAVILGLSDIAIIDNLFNINP